MGLGRLRETQQCCTGSPQLRATASPQGSLYRHPCATGAAEPCHPAPARSREQVAGTAPLPAAAPHVALAHSLAALALTLALAIALTTPTCTLGATILGALAGRAPDAIRDPLTSGVELRLRRPDVLEVSRPGVRGLLPRPPLFLQQL